MPKKILIISGSPKKDGNTAALIRWFSEGALREGATVDVVAAAYLKYKFIGCSSCRICQSSEKFECAIDDEAKPVLIKMADVDVIVMATPLYFFSAAAALKIIFDRMFSLYKWDNEQNTFETPLKGKTFVLMASSYEDLGMEALARPFSLTAEYTGMNFETLLIKNAGESGEIMKMVGVKERAIELGRKVAE